MDWMSSGDVVLRVLHVHLLKEIEFKQIFQISLDFAIANGGTIAIISEGQAKFGIHSFTTRTDILVERDQTQPGVWHAEQKQNAAGEKNHPTREIV